MSYFWKNGLVELKMIREEDSHNFYDVLMDTQTRKQAEHGIYLPATVQYAKDMADNAMVNNEEGDELWFSIRNMDEEPVGYAVIDWINEKMGNAQLSITVYRQYRGLGYAGSAASILLEYLFNERRFHKVGCNIMEDNEEGKTFVESMGFTLDAFRSGMFYTGGHYTGELYYSLLDFEYNGTGTDKERARKNYKGFEVFDSTLGKSEKHTAKGPLVWEQRPYYWEYDGIVLSDMNEEEYRINHEMIYDTESCIFFDSDVKLPYEPDSLSDFEAEHLNFGCEDDRIEFSIWDLEDNYAGCINLCGIDKKNGKFSFSIYILPEHRGKGYSVKALKLVLNYAFNELRMNKMVSCVNMGNDASAAMMRSVGCVVEGVSRDSVYYHGQYVDTVMFGLTAEDFKKHCTDSK